MSILARFLPNITSNSLKNVSKAPILSPLGLYEIATRGIIKCHFPRPNERMRILKHGLKKRLSTPAGRRVLMNRILRGRHVLAH